MSGDGAFVSLTKGPIHAAIEVCVNDPTNYYAKRQSLLQALKGLQPPEQEHIPDFLFIIKQIAQVTEAAAQYLEKHWFTWWGEKRFREPILRLGIIRAIEAANSDPEKILPIDFLWINSGKHTVQGNPAPSEAYSFETYVMRNPQQVTCLLLTPPSPRPSAPEYLAALVSDDHYWIVKDSADSDPAPGEELEAKYGDRLRTLRLKVLDPEYELQSLPVKRRARGRGTRQP